MSLSADALRKLAALRLDPEQMAGVLDLLADISASDEDRKKAQRERTRRHREGKRDGNVTVTDLQRDGDVTSSPSLPKRKVSPCTPSKENNPLSPTTSHPSDVRSGEARKRGIRVDGFEPEIATAVEMGLTPERARLQSEKFLDYWRGKPGKDGVKLDWPATWRNWVRSEVERHGAGPPGNGNVRAFPQPNRPLTPMEAYEARKAARGPVA